MTTSTHTQLQRVFEQARQLGPGERTEFLDQACAGDSEIRTLVEALLKADAEPDAMFNDAIPGGGAGVLARAMADSGELDEPEILHPTQVGKYRVLGVLGQGGMGVVYEAEQDDPKRRVALKVVRPDAITRSHLQRFRHETQILGHLRHPGIAQIYEAGTAYSDHGDRAFFAMELVEGETLRQYATTHDPSTTERLELIAALCDIIHYAHQKGVIHRDLKPSNVLIAEARDSSTAASREDSTPVSFPRLKVLDFGVARITDADLQTATLHTSVGQLIGTVPYMSPEQAAGDPTQIDTRSDVYAIGLIACELLTGKLPYDVRGKLVHEAVRVIQEEDPSSLSSINPAFRGDIETIVFKAIEKDKDRRYQSAAELAADLRRYLRNEPIEARPASVWYQTRKFARRNRVLVAGVLATVLVAVAGAGVASRYAVIASARADSMERASYISGIAAAMSAIDQHDHATAEAYLDQTPESHRGWEHDYLRARLRSHLAEWASPGLIITPVWSDEGSADLHAITRELQFVTWDPLGGPPTSVRPFAPEADPPINPSYNILVHPESARFAARDAEMNMVVAPVSNSEPPTPIFACTSQHANALAWDDPGERLVFNDHRTHLWDGESARVIFDEPASQAFFSHEGDRVALVFKDTVILVDPESGAVLARTVFRDVFTGVSFSPNDELIVAVGVYRNVVLFDAYSLEVVARLSGHQGYVTSPVWSNDGSRLATASLDGTVRIWDPFSAQALAVHRINIGESHLTLAIHDNEIIVTGEAVQRLPLYEKSVLRDHESYVYNLSFSPDGTELATSGYLESHVRVWDIASRSVRARVPAPKTFSMTNDNDAAPKAQFSEDGERLVLLSSNDTFNWDLKTLKPLEVSENPDPRERFLETLGRRAGVRTSSFAVLDASGRRDVVDILGGLPSISVFGWDISPDGKLVAGAQEDGDVSIFRSGSTKPIATMPGHTGAVYCVAFSPDGTRLATGGNDNTVRIWDTKTFEQLLVLRGHTQYVKAIEFSPDGSTIATASGDNTVRLWDSR